MVLNGAGQLGQHLDITGGKVRGRDGAFIAPFDLSPINGRNASSGTKRFEQMPACSSRTRAAAPSIPSLAYPNTLISSYQSASRS